MKKIVGLLAALIVSATAMAQATPHEKQVIKNDLKKEHVHRNAVAKNLLKAKPRLAKAQHRAAVAAHKKTKRDAKVIRDNDIERTKRRQPGL